MAKSKWNKKNSSNKKQNKNRHKTEIRKLLPKKPFPKKIVHSAVIFILILGAFLFLKNSSYFKLEKIDIVDVRRATELDANAMLPLYKGRNIFEIDINSIASSIESDYPVIKEAVVKRVLPNRLEIDIVSRVPVARIKSRKIFTIDRSGMVLSPGIKSHDLPVVTGFSMWTKIRTGEKLKNQQLESAFSLIDALGESAPGANYKVAEIDASNYKNLSFYLENGIEVKIGGEDFPNRLKALKVTLANPKLNKDNIKYIDLRFRDVVIGPK
ncbi:MAG: FtsQ-type POTRA domain-containing protein [Candidatus Omnitrophica bacterium]|nr:FtsQ-type POTRA domain-containing protein [Candidatus Omnitrophota bacterium]